MNIINKIQFSGWLPPGLVINGTLPVKEGSAANPRPVVVTSTIDGKEPRMLRIAQASESCGYQLEGHVLSPLVVSLSKVGGGTDPFFSPSAARFMPYVLVLPVAFTGTINVVSGEDVPAFYPDLSDPGVTYEGEEPRVQLAALRTRVIDLPGSRTIRVAARDLAAAPLDYSVFPLFDTDSEHPGVPLQYSTVPAAFPYLFAQINQKDVSDGNLWPYLPFEWTDSDLLTHVVCACPTLDVREPYAAAQAPAVPGLSYMFMTVGTGAPFYSFYLSMREVLLMATDGSTFVLALATPAWSEADVTAALLPSPYANSR